MLQHQVIHRTCAVQGILSQVPDIFTDGNGEAFPLEFDHVPVLSDFKIPVLVKYIVGRQTGFMYNGFYLMIVQKPGGIVQILSVGIRIGCGGSDNHTDTFCIQFDFFQGFITA